MRLLAANKILLASCVVVVPLSFYGGLALKEHYLSNELPAFVEERKIIHDRAQKARIVQLEIERKNLIEEGRNVDDKIRELKKRMQAGESTLSGK